MASKRSVRRKRAEKYAQEWKKILQFVNIVVRNQKKKRGSYYVMGGRKEDT